VYDITTTGRSLGTSPVTRTAAARIRTNHATPASAASFGAGINIGPRYTFNGDLVANGAVSNTGGTINGTVRTSYSGSDYTVPTAATLNYFGAGASPSAYTLPNGGTGTPQLVAGTITGFPAVAGTNPGKVFYSNGDLIVNATSTINFAGTLVVLGHLTVKGTTFAITPTSQMPALITTGQLRMNLTNINLQVNGLTWLGSGTAWTGGLNTNSKVTINGALLMPSGAGLGSTSTGMMTVNFSNGNVNVASLTTSSQPQPITSVRLLDWQQ
jgi:hypothetical protein